MGVAVLHPQDVFNKPFSHMKVPRSPISCPNRQKKLTPNRTRRSPPRNQTTRSPPPVAPPLPPSRSSVSTSVPKGTVKKNPTNGAVVGQLRILKRGEEIQTKKTTDPAVEIPDLVSKRQTVPNSSQIRLSRRKLKTAPLYAGPVTMTSPPPSDVPVPAFFTTKKSVSLFQAADATNDLIRILRLDIA